MKRYRQMDGVRAAAALAVVMIHVSSGGASGVQTVCNQLARFAVPLFILLSGFGHGGENQDIDAPLRLFCRRMRRILPPFVLWSVVYLLVDAAFGKPHERPLWDLVSGGAYIHLYFIIVLIQLEILYVPLYRAVRRAPHATLAAAAVLTLAMQVLICGEFLSLWTLPPLPLPYTRLFVPYLLFYVAGLWLRRRDRLPEKGNWLHLAGVAVLWMLSAALVVTTARRLPAIGRLSLRPDLTVYVFASGLLLWLLCSLTEQPSWPVRALSRLSFALYLSHPLVMRLWNEWTIRQKPVIYLRLWQSYLMTAAGGLLIAVAVSGLPFGSLLGGAPRKQPMIMEGQNGKKEERSTKNI